MAAINSSTSAALLATAALRRRYIRNTSGGDSEIALSIGGISCAGCIPGLENKIRRISGVKRAAINHSNFRASIVWDPCQTEANELLLQIQEFGYEVKPYLPIQQEKLILQEKKKALTRIIIALAFGMQVMMITIALYLGDAKGMEEQFRQVLRYAAMLMTLPVLILSARPFFENAWSGLKRSILNVDITVSLALILAFFGSVLATLGFRGQVYFESIVMFVVLLLSARYLEIMARQKGIAAISDMEKSMPETATKINLQGERSIVDVNELIVGDLVLVAPGALIPVDGQVETGESLIDESIITGESLPVSKYVGSDVIAGSANIQNSITIKVKKTAPESFVNNLLNVMTQGQLRKTRLSKLADRMASQFVRGVLIIALFAGVYWWFNDRSLWLPVVISTLVVACPCALSLAMPTAFAAAMSNLTRLGVLPMKSSFLERLPEIDHIIFDKTGTLTTGEYQVVKVVVEDGISKSEAIAIAQALNKDANHPIAKALGDLPSGGELLAMDVLHYTGGGVVGTINNDRWLIGSEKFVAENNGKNDFKKIRQTTSSGASVSVLSNSEKVLAKFYLEDSVRPEAKSVIAQLKRNHIGVSIYSGDSLDAVQPVAKFLDIDDYNGEMRPLDKSERVKHLQAKGKHIAVIGDGINDAPIIAEAAVSVAMGHGADLSKLHADIVLTHNSLTGIIDAINVSRRSLQIIKQNYTWAVGYNLLAIPAAIFGLIPPWAAALGMSTSALVISLNSLRLLTNSKSVNNSSAEPQTTADCAVVV